MQLFAEAFAEGWQLLSSGATDVWAIVLTSIRVSGAATAISLVLGIPLGVLLGSTHFGGRRLFLLLANTGMGLPPVAVGLVVAMTLSRRGPLGELGLLYSRPAMIIAQVVIALPIIVAVTAAAIAAVPRQLRLQARALGASRLHEAFLVLSEARMGVIAAVAAGFGSIISEVGAVMMVGGNIADDTQVLTTGIVQYTRMGRYGPALALAGVLLGLVTLVNVLLVLAQTSAERFEGQG